MPASVDSSSSAGSETPKRGIKRKREAPAGSSVKTKEIAVEAQGSSDSSDSDDNSDSGDEEGDAEPQKTEVLSHAAQRKLKKKAQKEAKRPQDADKSEDGAVDTPHKRQNSVWVGNLAFKTTEQALRVFFQRGVPGCEVTRVNLPTKTSHEVSSGRGMRGENRGFAYIDFKTKEDQVKAIALSEQHLDGRKLLIKDGGDFTGRPTAPSTAIAATGESGASPAVTSTVGKSKTAQRILASQKQPPAQTLFLGNLGFQATEQSIREMIEGHMKSKLKIGEKKDAEEPGNADSAKEKRVLKKVRLGTFEDSGLCKGFGFLDFATTEDATAVLLDPRNHHLDGRKLVVEYASADAVRRGGGPGAKAHRDKLESREMSKGDRRRPGKSARRDEAAPAGEVEEGAEGDADPHPKRQKREEGRRQEDRGGKARRTKPGAALALAQREKVAIVPSSGKKIVF